MRGWIIAVCSIALGALSLLVAGALPLIALGGALSNIDSPDPVPLWVVFLMPFVPLTALWGLLWLGVRLSRPKGRPTKPIGL